MLSDEVFTQYAKRYMDMVFRVAFPISAPGPTRTT